MKDHILLINASDEKNLPKVIEIKNLQLHLTLVGSACPEWIKPYVDCYVECDLKNQETTLIALKALYAKHPFHGAITFWDREVEITAVITNYFKLPGSDLQAVKNVKNKLWMRNILSEKKVNQVKYYPVKTREDLEAAAHELGYPFIFKPVAASASAGVCKIENFSQIQMYYDAVMNADKPDYWLYADSYIAEEYMHGNEVSVEGVVSHGQVHIAGITQKWKTEETFVEWQHCFPAVLSEKVEKDMARYTEKCIKAIGLDNTAFHVELIDCGGEIKVVEINARMGGDFITSYLLPLCDVNLAKAAIQAGLGLSFTLDKPKNYACVRFLLTETAGKLATIEVTKPVNEKVIKQFALLKKVNDIVALPPVKFADNRLCYVITKSDAFNQCIDSAKDFLDNVKFTIK